MLKLFRKSNNKIPKGLIDDIDSKLQSLDLTNEEKEELLKLKATLLEAFNVESNTKVPAKYYLAAIIERLLLFILISFFSIALFGIFFKAIVIDNFYHLLVFSSAIALFYVIEGGVDLLRLGYDRVYFSKSIWLFVLKIFALIFINTFFVKVFSNSFIWIGYILIIDAISIYISNKHF